ncbi:TPM domain-containing protein [Methylobacillus arboreus]|uniref:TPM domain-containing protein n=1 Tax=Methylobacillus arboreus TaxID=755170 RepID=UPI001E2F80B2|nr:TPM domain-containing protein [Methylobacillus arboreus]MCB5191191.1 TPM domain-containing protein [Methylobacillus arboreus]
MKKRNTFLRLLSHVFSTPWHVRRHFSKAALQRIEQAITASERTHNGEIRFVVEGDLHPMAVMRGVSPRDRAIALFSQLGIWDTEQNNGVLIYLLLADHDVEILADRGINRHLGQQGWEAICQVMQAKFRQGQFEEGVIYGINEIGKSLQQYFPATADDKNELPNKPIVL